MTDRATERDAQRSRVYASDRALIDIAKPLSTVTDVERYVKRVFGMKRVQDAFPKSRLSSWLPSVGDGRGRTSARSSSSEIAIPRRYRNEAVVLHELAHAVCDHEYGLQVAGHGWQFCSIYLTLTLHAMGREARDVLKAAMTANRVRFQEPMT